MPIHAKCKNCNNAISSKSYAFCPYCSQRADIDRIDFSTVIESFLMALHFETKKLVLTVRSMIFQPGRSMEDFLNGGRKKYQNPISYLFIGMLSYSLFAHYVAEPQHWYIGLLLSFNKYQLVLLILGISFIGWMISGIPRFNFFEIFFLFCFIYGTSFFITPLFVLAESPFIDYIRKWPCTIQYLASDLPSCLLVLYMSADFFKVTKVKWYKYALTAIVGYAYYLFVVYELASG